MTTQNTIHTIVKGMNWKPIVDVSPLAIYILKKDAGLTLLYGNRSFYEIFHTTKNNFAFKYGNRLSAMIDTQDYIQIQNTSQACFSFVHEISVPRKKQLYTQVQMDETKQLLFAVSMDISLYEHDRSEIQNFHRIVDTTSPYLPMEVFQYNPEKDEIQILVKKKLLTHMPEVLSYPTFEQKLMKQSNVEAEDMRQWKEVWHTALQSNETVIHEKKLGDASWLRLTLIPYHGVKRSVSLIVILEDISGEKNTYQEYLNITQFYHLLLKEKEAYAHVNVTKNSFHTMGGIWDLYNELVDEITYTQLYERFIHKVVMPQDRKDYLELMNPENLLRNYESGNFRLRYEFRRIIEQNKMAWMEIELLLFREPITNDLLALMFLNDIDERKKNNFQLQYESEFDQLTGIYRKNVAENLIYKELSQHPHKHLRAFLIFDMDNFKDINDLYGHKKGDETLAFFSSMLRTVFHKDSIVGRFGGDEFIVFVKKLHAREDLDRALHTLYQQMEARGIMFSTGITLIDQPMMSYEEIFVQADRALYREKKTGKGSFHYYHEQPCAQDDLSREDAALSPSLNFHYTRVMNASEIDSYLGEFGDIAYLVDPDTYDLILGNQSFYDRIGLTKEQCRGMKCYEIMHHRGSPCPFCGKTSWSRDKYYIWKDNNRCLEQDFLIKNKLIPWHDQEVLLAIAIDISNDKSIVDSMESYGTESHILLSAIQHMQEHMDMEGALHSVLDSIVTFFHADSAEIWQKPKGDKPYKPSYQWCVTDCRINFTEKDQEGYDSWLRKQQWDAPVNIENPQQMMQQSYAMYQIMQRHLIRNQRWVLLQDQGVEYGCLVINNIAANFRNISFLDSLTVFIVNEMKKRKLIEAMIHANDYDYLTDLLNRNSFVRNCKELQDHSLHSIGVVMANIDHLKEINRVNGTTTGDQYIQCFAHLLKQIFTTSDIYRLNGDEFLVLTPNCEKKDVDQKVKECKSKLSHENFTVSFGAVWDDMEKNIAHLMQTAGNIMQFNKRMHYEEMQDAKDMRQRKLLHDLMTGIQHREYVIYLQPKVHMNTHKVVGAEALIRQNHKELGVLAPAEFVPALESNHLIRYIDLFVFEEVCKLLEGWNDDTFRISLNFSRVTLLEDHLLDHLKQVLEQYTFPYQCLEIEITESACTEHSETLYEVIKEISALGLRVSLDDFGISYSNLSILSDVCFDTIKLDKSLIKSLATEKRNHMIVKHMIQMCTDLEMESIAEGIETEYQESILLASGCITGQGYLYGKPVPVDEFRKALSAGMCSDLN